MSTVIMIVAFVFCALCLVVYFVAKKANKETYAPPVKASKYHTSYTYKIKAAAPDVLLPFATYDSGFNMSDDDLIEINEPGEKIYEHAIWSDWTETSLSSVKTDGVYSVRIKDTDIGTLSEKDSSSIDSMLLRFKIWRCYVTGGFGSYKKIIKNDIESDDDDDFEGTQFEIDEHQMRKPDLKIEIVFEEL